MIIDSSALVAILQDEPERDLFKERITQAIRPIVAAPSYVETSIVVDARRDPVLSRGLDEMITDFGIVIEPFTAQQAMIARRAYRDFGRGSGHPAKLNYGDCLSYAMAKDRREPLLYKGDDFVHTDVEPAA